MTLARANGAEPRPLRCYRCGKLLLEALSIGQGGYYRYRCPRCDSRASTSGLRQDTTRPLYRADRA